MGSLPSGSNLSDGSVFNFSTELVQSDDFFLVALSSHSRLCNGHLNMRGSRQSSDRDYDPAVNAWPLSLISSPL